MLWTACRSNKHARCGLHHTHGRLHRLHHLHHRFGRFGDISTGLRGHSRVRCHGVRDGGREAPPGTIGGGTANADARIDRAAP